MSETICKSEETKKTKRTIFFIVSVASVLFLHNMNECWRQLLYRSSAGRWRCLATFPPLILHTQEEEHVDLCFLQVFQTQGRLPLSQCGSNNVNLNFCGSKVKCVNTNQIEPNTKLEAQNILPAGLFWQGVGFGFTLLLLWDLRVHSEDWTWTWVSFLQSV